MDKSIDFGMVAIYSDPCYNRSMKTYTQLNAELSQVLQTNGDLEPLKVSYTHELKRIEVFMEMFLEKYGKRILGDKTNSPEWNLYTQKTEAYNNYNRMLRQVDYFIAKQKV